MTELIRYKIKHKKRRLAGNAMFQLNRQFRAIEGLETNLECMSEELFQAYLQSITFEPLPEFEDYVHRKIEVWTSFLAEENLPWPCVPVRVVIADDGVPEWIEITDDNEIVGDAVGTDATFSVMLGSEYIDLVVEPFSFAWWLNRLCKAGIRLLNCEDENARMYITFELGRCEREFEIYINESEAVETGHKTRDERKRGGGHNRDPDHGKIVSAMQGYIDSGRSKTDAARFTFEKLNLGSSVDANRDRYYRHTKRLTKKSEEH